MKLYNKTEKEAVDMMRDMDKKRKCTIIIIQKVNGAKPPTTR